MRLRRAGSNDVQDTKSESQHSTQALLAFQPYKVSAVSLRLCQLSMLSSMLICMSIKGCPDIPLLGAMLGPSSLALSRRHFVADSCLGQPGSNCENPNHGSLRNRLYDPKLVSQLFHYIVGFPVVESLSCFISGIGTFYAPNCQFKTVSIP